MQKIDWLIIRFLLVKYKINMFYNDDEKARQNFGRNIAWLHVTVAGA